VFGFTGTISLIGISYIFTGQALKPVKETWIRQKEIRLQMHLMNSGHL